MNENQYISIDPGILRGKPCITGTRMSVELILELLSLGYSINDILDDYPQLTREQIFAVLDFARERIHVESENLECDILPTAGTNVTTEGDS